MCMPEIFLLPFIEMIEISMINKDLILDWIYIIHDEPNFTSAILTVRNAFGQ